MHVSDYLSGHTQQRPTRRTKLGAGVVETPYPLGPCLLAPNARCTKAMKRYDIYAVYSYLCMHVSDYGYATEYKKYLESEIDETFWSEYSGE